MFSASTFNSAATPHQRKNIFENEKSSTSASHIDLEYKCQNCSKINHFEPTDPIKCKYCTYRIVSKVRNQKPRKYLAR